MNTVHNSTHLSLRNAVPEAPGTLHTVSPGRAFTLTAKRPMSLRVADGQAWVTLGNGELTDGDLVLGAGQTLQLAAGQQVVMESLSARPVQVRWSKSRSAAHQAAVAWWQRASLSSDRSLPYGVDDASCA